MKEPRKDPTPTDFGASAALPMSWFWNSSLQNCEGRHFRGVKPPSLWHFVLGALGNSHAHGYRESIETMLVIRKHYVSYCPSLPSPNQVMVPESLHCASRKPGGYLSETATYPLLSPSTLHPVGNPRQRNDGSPDVTPISPLLPLPLVLALISPFPSLASGPSTVSFL